ncbi:TPA: DUF262 domain-containing protein [Pseudomonas aeruginosa]|uniref:DUF262 domain-containing protein n=1 Tax=Pseudomonas aeruginosa TaxID=287 RepID=UPI000BA79393|nr:DUF262 domain-containing protein [Pseudomonas aeruginosa]MCO2649259.1 DUF262 domain-containing protein [Pseudomonas aeruginosa]MCS8280341.1 DUF262 domain-containing protein [Pseudomonas aeruginosa]MCT4514326.1 DUF262 domain-containing protein [Pseudomonas aeruginosa]MCT4519708.1 DUF262 domain-containing protein [Pseudomonas aeruginosa]MCT4539382.1 DUF262 domain-containing protein [Pseudomonas aeruginosa]
MSKIDIQKLEEQIYLKRREVRYDMRDLTVEYISDKYSDGIEYSETDEEERSDLTLKRNVLFIPEYQREFTWDERRSSKLIESILLGLPIPFIFVAENSDGAWEIVDGSQRIRAIHYFVTNNLQLTGLESLTQANGIKFDNLENSRKGKFLDTALRLIILSEETTDDVKKDMFERINRGSDLLKPMEKRKGIYTGKFTSFIYNYVESDNNFKELVKVDKWLETRQERQELLLRFFALSENHAYTQGISGSLSEFLDHYLERKNSELQKMPEEKADEEIIKYKQKIDSVNKVVTELFPFGYRHKANPQTKRSVFEAISVGVWAAIETGKLTKKIDKDHILQKLSQDDFKKCTHVANQLHKKPKLSARINYIRDLLTEA